jgi:hypothetical protein
MNMEIETQQAGGAFSGALEDGIAHLAAAAAQLERTATAIEARFDGGNGMIGGDVPKVVAAIEGELPGGEASARLAELETRMKAAERQIAELRANAGGTLAAAAGRKTLPLTTTHLLAKHGIDTLDQVNGGALDAALNGLSLEQRIAVKSQLMRAGLLG